MISTAPTDPMISLAGRLADASGAVIRKYFRTQVDIHPKADNSPVTIADREAESAIREILSVEVPEHGVLGEEHGQNRIDAEYVWVLDPIDGTKSFISGAPLFGTLIALLHRNKPVLGIIDQPISGERWLGLAGQDTTLNGVPVRTRASFPLTEATLTTTSPDMFSGQDMAAFVRVRDQVRMTRYGLDCYGYGLLALGFVDLVVEASLQPYDYCALVPIVEGAGGVITDWQGGRLDLRSDGRLLAAGNARLHAAALEILNG